MPDGATSTIGPNPSVKPARTLEDADDYFALAVETLDDEEAENTDFLLKLQPYARILEDIQGIERAHDLKMKEIEARRNTYLSAAYAFVSRRKHRITQRGAVKTPKVQSGRFRWSITPTFRIRDEKLFIAEAEASVLKDNLVKIEKKPLTRLFSSTDDTIHAILGKFASLVPVKRRGFTFWSSRRPERFVLTTKNGERAWSVKLPDDKNPAGGEVEDTR